MVAPVSRNQVDMHMEDTLPRGAPNVNTNVVAIGAEFGVQIVALCDDQVHTGRYLFRGQLEEIRAMPQRDDECMPRTHGVTITRSISQCVLARDLAGSAKQTGIVGIAHDPALE